MKIKTSRISVTLCLFSVMMVSVVSFILPGSQATGTPGAWTAFSTPTSNTLLSVYMVPGSNGTDGWASGFSGIMLHYAGGSWAIVSVPTSENLYSVFMVSASDGWAVGSSGTILHYIGGSWHSVSSPTSYSLFSVFMVSASDGWIVGYQGLILHYAGTSWIPVSSPTSEDLYSVFMVDTNLGWATGYGTASFNIIKYSGGSWAFDAGRPAPPALGPIALRSVFMASATEGWSVGDGVLFGGGYNGLLHYYSGAWHAEAGARGSSVFMTGTTEGWFVGAWPPELGRIWHYSGSAWSHWSLPSLVLPLYSLFMVDSTYGWSVGAGGEIWLYGLSRTATPTTGPTTGATTGLNCQPTVTRTTSIAYSTVTTNLTLTNTQNRCTVPFSYVAAQTVEVYQLMSGGILSGAITGMLFIIMIVMFLAIAAFAFTKRPVAILIGMVPGMVILLLVGSLDFWWITAIFALLVLIMLTGQERGGD